MRRVPWVLLAVLAGARGLAAQEGQRPAGWLVRPDVAGTADSLVSFATMTPGWHITSPTAAVLVDPAQRGSGAFRLESQVYLFPASGNDEVGVLAFGHDLDGARPGYTAFVLRNDGAFAVLRRDGEATTALVPWSAAPIIASPQPGLPARNDLLVEADADSVRFSVNGAELAAVARSAVGSGDRVGLRIGAGTNVHVTSLTTSPGQGGGTKAP